MGEAAEMDDSLRDLAEAWDAVEEDNADEIQSEGTEQIESNEPAGSGPEGEDQQPADPQLVSDGEGDGNQPSEPNEADNAPVSWSALAREHWKDIPKEAREYIQQREQQMQDGMRKNAEMAKRAVSMDRALQPFGQLFAMNGGPGQFIPQILQTASLLQMGTPAQKAQMTAQLINQFGVDIKALDSVLVGQDPPQGVQQQSEVQQQIAQALAPFQQQLSTLQQREQYERQQQAEQVNNELGQFASNPQNEFYNDVKMDMADLLDNYAKHGQPLTLQQAYEKACQMHPQISQIVQARQSTATVQQKRQAASSVTGNPGGAGGSSQPDSVRAALEEAWDGAGRL